MNPLLITREILNSWTIDQTGPVALHLKQRLLPVGTIDGDEGVVFPPTYVDIGYNIDTLSDGTKIATIDSVGSQANRMEPLFKSDAKEREDWLVPQVAIKLHDGKTVSLLDLAHRAADATVLASPTLNTMVADAFAKLKKGDAWPLCGIAPTSLIFGVWDSRGDSSEKRPRLVRSVIRATHVERLSAAAQFNSVWKLLDDRQQEELKAAEKKEKVDLSVKGFADAPAIFRKTKIAQFKEGLPNQEARVLGGVLVRGAIEREVTVNLVALRSIRGEDDDKTKEIRRYLLGLSLFAATAELDLYLREGCHLRYKDEVDTWYTVPRRGAPKEVTLVRGTIEAFLRDSIAPFRTAWAKRWPDDTKPEYEFNLSEAKKLLAKKSADEQESGAGLPG